MNFRASHITAFIFAFAGAATACEKAMDGNEIAPSSSIQLAQTSKEPEESTMSVGNTDPRTQIQGLWKVTVLGGEDLPGDAKLTLEFDASDVSGFTGCNTFSARAIFGLHNFRFDNISSTELACDAQRTEREALFLDKLSRVDLFVMNPGDVLTFHDEANEILISAVRQ